MTEVSRGIDRIEVTFDEPNLVANAGLVLVATVTVRLGLERLINATVDLSGRVGGALPGRKVLTLVHAMAAGGSHIDHADMLRSGATGSVFGHRVMAPSTLGTFLRAFTFGHVRQLDRVLGEALRRAWALGAGPGSEQLVIDLDSTICEVCGKAKHGAGYGYTKVLGYHPLIAVRAWTGEVLHVRMRKGAANTQRGAVRFVEELAARVRRAGASGELIMRFDSGFWSNATLATLERLDVGYTMGVRMITAVTRAVEGIDESAWTPIDYTVDGEAEVAECDYKGRRLSRPPDPAGRAPSHPVAPVAAFRLRDRYRRPSGRHRPVPPCSCHRRAGHPRPEGGRRPRARPFGALLRQLGLAAVCRSRPRRHALDGPARRHHPRGPSHRGPHRAHPLLVDPGPPRQPFRPTDAKSAVRVAVGRRIQPGPRPSAPYPRSLCSPTPRGRRTADDGSMALTTEANFTKA